MRWDRYLGLRLVIGLGTALAVCDYASNRSLWLDEAKLSRNFLGRNWLQLLSPLDHDQVAPIGYLWTVEGSFELCRGLGLPVEYGLRLPSLVAFLGVAYLTWHLARRLTGSALAALCASAFVCSNPYALRYASEAKQYMLDTAVALLVFMVSLSVVGPVDDQSGTRASQQPRGAASGLPAMETGALRTGARTGARKGTPAAYALFGAICIWLSNIAVLFLVVGGSHVVVHRFRAEGSARWAWAPVVWMASFGAYFALFVHGHPTRDFMVRYWQHAFLPWPPWSPAMGPFVSSHLVGMLSKQLAGPLWAPLVVALLGSIAWAIWRRNYRLASYASLPVLLHLALSGLSLYPFAARLTLYIVPVAGLLLGYIVGEVARALGQRRWVPILATIPWLVPLSVGASRFPFEKEEYKQTLAYVNAHWVDGQSVYVHTGARQAFEFYRSIGRKPPVDPTVAIVGKAKDGVSDQELAGLKGDVWFLFTYVGDRKSELNGETRTIAKLEQRGARVVRSHLRTGSSAYLVAMR